MKKALISSAFMAAFGAVITPVGSEFATDQDGCGFFVALGLMGYYLSLPGTYGLAFLHPVLAFLGVTGVAALSMGGAFSYALIGLLATGLAWSIRLPFLRRAKAEAPSEPEKT